MKTETVRNDNIPAVLAALREKLEDTEQEWQDRILDYIAENYPTQRPFPHKQDLRKD